ncbi:MAG TPA: hypothetical protein VG891_09545 [Rhizomicrobium sp.]|nr:hypothetical protein [Rhizomicrobium sp.]
MLKTPGSHRSAQKTNSAMNGRRDASSRNRAGLAASAMAKSPGC